MTTTPYVRTVIPMSESNLNVAQDGS
jgi:hypothetical protein